MYNLHQIINKYTNKVPIFSYFLCKILIFFLFSGITKSYVPIFFDHSYYLTTFQYYTYCSSFLLDNKLSYLHWFPSRHTVHFIMQSIHTIILRYVLLGFYSPHCRYSKPLFWNLKCTGEFDVTSNSKTMLLVGSFWYKCQRSYAIMNCPLCVAAIIVIIWVFPKLQLISKIWLICIIFQPIIAKI